jgi:hypothetical protein
MAFPWLLAASGVASIFGSGSSRGNVEIPDWLQDILRQGAAGEGLEGFQPDSDVFMESINAQVDEILAQLPVAQEAFNADAAARGVFGSPESLKNLYADVYSPIARSATSVATQGLVGLEGLKQQGAFQAAQVPLQYANILGGLYGQNRSSGGVRGAIGDIGGSSFQALLLNELGAFD